MHYGDCLGVSVWSQGLPGWLSFMLVMEKEPCLGGQGRGPSGLLPRRPSPFLVVKDTALLACCHGDRVLSWLSMIRPFRLVATDTEPCLGCQGYGPSGLLPRRHSPFLVVKDTALQACCHRYRALSGLTRIRTFRLVAKACCQFSIKIWNVGPSLDETSPC